MNSADEQIDDDADDDDGDDEGGGGDGDGEVVVDAAVDVDELVYGEDNDATVTNIFNEPASFAEAANDDGDVDDAVVENGIGGGDVDDVDNDDDDKDDDVANSDTVLLHVLSDTYTYAQIERVTMKTKIGVPLSM